MSASVKQRAAVSEWHEQYAHAAPALSQPNFLAVLTSNSLAFERLSEQLQTAMGDEACACLGCHTGCSALMHACALSAATIASLAEAAAFYGDVSGGVLPRMHLRRVEMNHLLMPDLRVNGCSAALQY